MKYKITAPLPGYRGDLAGLIFRDGESTADSVVDAAALAYCRRRGYTVVSLDDIAAPEPVAEAEGGAENVEPVVVERPKDYASKPEWVDYAVHEGADRDAAEQLTKSELVEQYGTQERKP